MECFLSDFKKETEKKSPKKKNFHGNKILRKNKLKGEDYLTVPDNCFPKEEMEVLYVIIEQVL